MLEAAKQVALVCDHTKFGNTALAKVCRLDELEHIITMKAFLLRCVKRWNG
ncbi:hypothetical protein D3H35_26065 [Cohnella faecalis]|uniref:DeoR-like transcriptional repressor C-terminal sensor domain-containing protein n=1 Tax=Cohnella faecalis TaxID=2315694 RepID=A0A398CPJ7_9BACL|nr:hypothetical protein D3H35_26065 [Cohnella faecalis]